MARSVGNNGAFAREESARSARNYRAIARKESVGSDGVTKSTTPRLVHMARPFKDQSERTKHETITPGVLDDLVRLWTDEIS